MFIILLKGIPRKLIYVLSRSCILQFPVFHASRKKIKCFSEDYFKKTSGEKKIPWLVYIYVHLFKIIAFSWYLTGLSLQFKA